jgi:hypothetical protein
MRALVVGILSLTLIASAALAAGDNAPLAPGKPAGVKKAQGGDHSALIIITGIVAAGVAIGLGTSSSGNPAGFTSNTGATSTA